MKQKKFDSIFLATFIGIVVLVIGILAIVDNVLGLNINWYGLLIGIAFLVAIVIIRELAYIKDFEKDIAFDLLLVVFPFAIIGARLFYVAFSGTSWTFLEILQVWNGGLSIIGGVIGGFLALLVYALIKKKNIFAFTDLIVPVLMLGQAIGRWGNYVNQEVFGQVVTNKHLQWFPFAVFIDATNSWHYALFFYESMLNLIGAIIIFAIFKKVKKTGYFTSAYLIYYGLIRSIMEVNRYSEFILQTGNGLPASQIVSISFVVLGLALLTYTIISDIKERKNAQNNNGRV